jgi:hypothetical protein
MHVAREIDDNQIKSRDHEARTLLRFNRASRASR